MILVKNLKNTADRKPYGYTSWIDWWEAKKNRKFPYYCSVYNCYNHAEVGGHVKKVSGGNEWYITPICKKCNNRNDEFYVSATSLEPINQ